jgi:hypothetical protein
MKNLKFGDFTFENLMAIASLVGVKLNYNYIITDYSLLTPTIGNRGGLRNKRVKTYINLINSGMFDFDLSAILVDINGNIIEGHHRFEALKICGAPVVIKIVKAKTLSQIARFNAIKTNWVTDEFFGASVTIQTPLSMFIEKLLFEVQNKYKLDKKKFTTNEMYGLLVKSTKHFSGKNAPDLDMWENSALLPVAKKRDYKNNVFLYGKLKSEFKNNRDAYKICKAVTDMHFDVKIDFDLELFCEALQYEGFVLEQYKSKQIKAKAMSMYAKQLKYNKAA